MKKNEIFLQIITPRGVKFERRAKMLIFRCIDGDRGILPGHEAASMVLGDGVLRILSPIYEPEERIAVFGGIAMVKDNTVKFLTTIAQRPEEIDLIRAERDKEQIERLLEENEDRKDDIETRRSQVLLRRALVRIDVSSYPDESQE